MATSRFIALKTWSVFTINLPFSTLGIVVGNPIWVPAGTDEAALEASRLAVERGLNESPGAPMPLLEPPTPCLT